MKEVRTRFAPSPTGYMHIGNLRTALYSYLVAKSNNGKFILRIEDTDKKRQVNDAINIIYDTLKQANLLWDEGPDVGGEYGPYIQSERVALGIYKQYAELLVKKGYAYYCFCPDCHSDLERYKPEVNYGNIPESKDFIGYNGHCRNLTETEIIENFKQNKPYVIRQKIPRDLPYIQFEDIIYGTIRIDTKILDDQVLIKQDGYPTYNFANVIDDHLMKITHIVRGNEYISSMPKYILLYQAFEWNIPTFIHLPLINGKDDEGNISKLSKRFGAVSFQDLINEGYLSDAIINYIAFLGWNPKNNNEIFSINDIVKIFNIKQLNKAAAIFDYKKLDWFNNYYIKNMPFKEFKEYGKKYLDSKYNKFDWDFIAKHIQSKINKFTDINPSLEFLLKVNNFDTFILFNNKYNIKEADIIEFINWFFDKTKDDLILDVECYNQYLKEYAEQFNKKFGFGMWIFRISLSGLQNTILGGLEIAHLLSVDEVRNRLKSTLEKIKIK